MKALMTGVGVAVISAGLLIWEESRIAELKKEIAGLKKEAVRVVDSSSAPEGSPEGNASTTGPGGKSGHRPADKPGVVVPGGDAREQGDRALGETIRKMFENPAGRAMIQEENKVRAAGLYGSLIEQFGLNKEEEAHFLALVGPSIGEEDAVGMKLFAAKNDEERMKILDDMEADQAARREAVKEFLNDEDDFATYERYEERKGAHEQMPGIRAVMEEAGLPMGADQETALVEAMFEAMNDGGMSERWEGRAGFMQFGEPGVSTRFEEDWGQFQESLGGRVEDFLEQPQREALDQHQDQIKQFHLMGIRMVEGMIQQAQPGQGP